MNMVQQFDPAQVDYSQDLGTPGAESDVMVTVYIDGMPVSVPEGTSVMRAAAMVGANIPKLCATDNLNAFGSCRLCLVEIEGRPGTPASCTTPCAEGMSVHTQTPRLDKLRKGVMELYISDHPLDCLTCPANGDCELQDMAGAVGLRDVRYGMEGRTTCTRAKTNRIPISPLMPANASCAAAACARVLRCRAPSR